MRLYVIASILVDIYMYVIVFSRAIDFNFKDNKNIKSLNKVCAGDIYYYIPRFPFNGQEDFVSPIRLYETIRRNNTNSKYLY